MAFFGLICLTLFNQIRYGFVVYDKSEMVGWVLGSNLEVMASSELLRKPKKAKINMASNVRAIWRDR